MSQIPTAKNKEGALKPEAEYRGHVYENFAATIGATPLVKLPRFKEKYGLEADVLAKLEFFNPLGSVKDRLAWAMVEAAEREGKIKPGKTTLVEPTSGNTGIALAFVAAAKGYRLILTMPETMSIERRKMLRFLGAELVLTMAEHGMKGAVDKAEQVAGAEENAVILGQFKNPANPQIHAETTAAEIWNDTGGRVDIVISGVGTGGTITGLGAELKAQNKDIKMIALEPADSPVLSGGDPGPHKIQGIGAGFIPDVLKKELIDEVITIENEDAFMMAREVARLEGIPCGISSGAALQAAKDVAARPENKGKVIVAILSSFAERYISTALFDGPED